MTPQNGGRQSGPEPRGFGEHTRGLSGEYAHEQGWGLAVEQRTKAPLNPDGGSNYDYGARDFGDEPINFENATEDSHNEQDQESR